MSYPGETLAEKQHRLAADIARQRGQLADAYRDIAKPILYTEYALRGFGFLRQNPWVLTIGPATFSIVSTVIGLIRNKPAKSDRRKSKWFAREEEREAGRETKGLMGHAMKWGGHGWKIFRLYRRFRKYLPIP